MMKTDMQNMMITRLITREDVMDAFFDLCHNLYGMTTRQRAGILEMDPGNLARAENGQQNLSPKALHRALKFMEQQKPLLEAGKKMGIEIRSPQQK